VTIPTIGAMKLPADVIATPRDMELIRHPSHSAHQYAPSVATTAFAVRHKMTKSPVKDQFST